MELRWSAAAGVTYILIFDFLAAGRAVYVGNLVQGIPPLQVAFWTFTIAAGFFLLLHLPKLGALFQKVRENRKNVVAVTLTTAISWLTYFYALKHLEPAIDTAIAFAIPPFITVLLWKRLRPQQPILPGERVAAAGILMSVIFLGVTVVSGHSAFVNTTANSIFGVTCALISGTSSAINTIYAKRLADGKLSAASVMAVRFWLLLLVCLLLWPAGLPELVPSGNLFYSVAVLAFAGVVVPLFALQKGIERSEPITVALATAILPAISYSLQWFDARLNPSLLSLAGVSACIFFTVYGIRARIVDKN